MPFEDIPYLSFGEAVNWTPVVDMARVAVAVAKIVAVCLEGRVVCTSGRLFRPPPVTTRIR
jgi:hypothetical protein